MRLWLLAAAALVVSAATVEAGGEKGKRPNIVWITCEDIGPNLGCYGDKYATTPNPTGTGPHFNANLSLNTSATMVIRIGAITT